MFDMELSGCLNDDSIGPGVRGCRDDFDFTLKFEKVFLSLLPASVFVAICLPRLVYLLRRPAIVRGTYFMWIKLVRVTAGVFLVDGLLTEAIVATDCCYNLFMS